MKGNSFALYILKKRWLIRKVQQYGYTEFCSWVGHGDHVVYQERAYSYLNGDIMVRKGIFKDTG